MGEKPETIIVTRHPGVVQWLREEGWFGKVYASVTEEDIKGKHVIGELPAHVAQYASYMTAIVYDRPFHIHHDETINDIETIKAAGPKLFHYMAVPVLPTEYITIYE